MDIIHCTSQNPCSSYMNSVWERVTWRHVIPQVFPDLPYSTLHGMFSESESSGCLIVGYQKICFQIRLSIKSRGCFKSCLYSL